MQTEQLDDEWRECRDELRRAYLLVGFGNVDEAIEICRDVAARLDGAHHLPGTLAGEFLVAKGDVCGAIRQLRETVTRFPEEPLPQLHFAEACYLDGRTEQGDRALERARALDDGAHAEFLDTLEETWRRAESLERPPPVQIDAER